MRTSYKIAVLTSILASLSLSPLGWKAEASVVLRRAHQTPTSAGFLTAGTASDPDIASASSGKPVTRRATSRIAIARSVLRRSQIGTASFYHTALVGRPTASGDPYSEVALTAAHRTLDLGTRVRVTNLANSRSVVVTVNDRGPYVRGRIIDLSRRAALMLGFVHEGIARVKIDPLGKSARTT